MRYMHPDEIEEMEYQANARYDYLSEAFGAEARMLQQQAIDEQKDPRTHGYFSEAGMVNDNEIYLAKARCRAALAKQHPSFDPVDDDVPF